MITCIVPLIIDEGMKFFKAWVNTEGSLAHFAAIFSLVPVTCCSITADFAIRTTPIWYWLGKGPLFEPKRKLRDLGSDDELLLLHIHPAIPLQLLFGNPAELALCLR